MNDVDLEHGDLTEELAALNAVDWPSDEVGDRVARAVVERWAAERGDADASAPPSPAGVSRGLRNALVVSAGAACLALVVVLATGVLQQGPGKARASVSSRVTEPTIVPTTTTGTSLPSRPNGSVMVLVDSTSSPFQLIGSGTQSGNLTCVTARVCLAQAVSGGDVELTEDGGRAWRGVSALPGDAELQWPLSCPSTAMCMGIAAGASPAVAVTADLGSTWSVDTVAYPTGWTDVSVTQLSCASATTCVVQVVGQSAGAQVGTFLTSADGGATWTPAVAEPATSRVVSWALTCDSDVSCVSVGLGPVTATSGTLVALTTDDGGRTWTSRSDVLPIGKGVLLVDCGDADHCIAAFPNATGEMDYASTSTAGADWAVANAPASWPRDAVALSCATADDCYLSAANLGGPVPAQPVIEATHDGGSTWTALGLPQVGGHPLAVVFPLSCPVAAGCIGVGASTRQLGHPSTPVSPETSGLPMPLGAIRCTAPGASGGPGGAPAATCELGPVVLRCRWQKVPGGEKCSTSYHVVPMVMVVEDKTVVSLAFPEGPPGSGPSSTRVIISNLPG